VPLVLIPALGLTQGGYQPDAWVWAGALAAWAAAVAVLAANGLGLLRTAWPWPVAAAVLLGWTALSSAWSTRPPQSWLDARRTLVYVAVVLALVLLARSGSTQTLVLATHAAVTVVLIYALARYLLGTRHNAAFEGYLLNQPFGYANAIGIVAALGALLALGLACERLPVAAATVPLFALALTLSGSHASWLALGAGLVVEAALTPSAYRLGAVLALVALPSAALVLLAHYSRLAASTPSPRVAGSVVAGAALAAVAATAVAARAVRLPQRVPAQRVRVAVLSLGAAVAVAAVVAVAVAGPAQPRSSYWHVAWNHELPGHVVAGTGAGTFGFYWLRDGAPATYGGALDAHSLYLETLAELGVVGLIVLLVFVAVPLTAVRSSRGYAGAAAFAAYCTFLLHAALDWDWEMPVVVVLALCCGAAVLAGRRAAAAAPGAKTRGLVLVAALVLAALAIAGVRSHTEPAAKTAKAPQLAGPS